MATMAIDIEQWDNGFLAAWQTRNIEKILTFYTDDCIVEDVAAGKVNHNKEELRAFLKDYYAGSPDLSLEKKSFTGSGSRFCTEWIMSGTHSGNWSFLPATGKRFSIQGVSLIDLKDGKVMHQTDYYDGASLMRQLGPPPSPHSQGIISTVMNLEKRISEKSGNVRRIVTGHNDGKSVVLDDSEIPAQTFLGFELNELWGTTRIPTIPVEEADYRKQLELWRGEPMPDSGAVRVRLGILPPDEEFFRYAKGKGEDPVEDWRKAFGDDFRMHTTDTVDIGIVLSGALCMVLDDGVEVLLKPGDVVVNCGTRHGWRNRGKQNCIAAFVCIGAHRLK